MQKLDFDWIYTKERLDKTNIDDKFTILAGRRDVRQGKVTKLRALLNRGEHFDTPFMVNQKDGKYRLLDGNHRFEAIRSFLKNGEKDKYVVIGVCVYKDLNPEQEREIYTKWNLGTKQNAADFLKQYWTKIPITRNMIKPHFPINVGYKWGKNALDFKVLTIGYIGWKMNVDGRATQHTNTNIGFYADAMSFIEEAKELEEKDFRILKAFMTDYIAVFGTPDRLSHYYKTSVFLAIQRIWLGNFARYQPCSIQRKLMKLVGHERVLYWRRFGPQRGVVKIVINDFLNVINANCKNENNRMVVEL